MRNWLRRLGTLLLFVAVALCFAPSLIPPFLDRIYYRGPPSDHFDGQRFFNPDLGRQAAAHGGPARFFSRWLSGAGDRATWPKHVETPAAGPSFATQVCGKPNDLDTWAECETAKNLGLMEATWVGHATVLVQAYGLNILTDPILSDRASPFSFIGPRRVRRPGIALDDLPSIDLIIVSHNHYDHLDLPTLKALWERDHPLIVTSLGNDAILKAGGIQAQAGDWGETISRRRSCAREFDPCQPRELKVTVERTHHWSSRWGTDRNRALWSGFTVHLPRGNIFFAGDTGYGDGSWAADAAKRGPIRLAILPIGAYEPRDVMQANHMDPDEALRVFETLKPNMALGIHWGTFQLTFESIDDPPGRLAAAKRARGSAADKFVTTEVGRTFRVP